MTQRWLVLRLEAPLMSFGTVMVDKYGPTGDFPTASMLTGLIANALGWQRTDGAAHQALQHRLVFAARSDRPGSRLTDMQNVQLHKTDKGWTTHGTAEGRQGATYDTPHRRERVYCADALIVVVLRLLEDATSAALTLDDIAHALERPIRPLFLGRKPCLPTAPLITGFIEAATAYEALQVAPPLLDKDQPATPQPVAAMWPLGEAPQGRRDGDHRSHVSDQRNWHSGLHGGSRVVVEGWLEVAEKPQ